LRRAAFGDILPEAVLDLLAYWGFAAFARFVRLLPLGVALAFGAAVGRLMLVFVPKRRRLMLENLALAFPGKSEAERKAIARGCAADLGRTLMEVLRLPDLTEAEARERVRVENAAVFGTFDRIGKGALCVSAHFGNFEYIAAGVNRLGLYKCHLIGRKIKNARVDAAIRGLRASQGVDTILNKRSTPEILSRLKQNQGIGVVLDQNMKRKVGIFVDFFGRPACTTPGLAVLAERSGAPVISAFIVRESAYQAGGDPRKHVLVLSDPIPWEPNDDRAQAIRVNTQRYTQVIEDWVRRYPTQWFWLHDRWKTQPVEGWQMRRNALEKPAEAPAPVAESVAVPASAGDDEEDEA
jgi:KDO2-lipid IV(A) lauroyltransferase